MDIRKLRGIIQNTLQPAGIVIDGPNPWDIHINNERFFKRVLGEGSLGLGESFMQGWWDCDCLDEFFYRLMPFQPEEAVKGNLKLQFNILKASVTPKEEGLLVMEVSGRQRNYNNALGYLAEVGVEVQSLTQDVARREDRCTHCGACVTICPVGALVVDPVTRRVDFLEDKCIACELCIRACPLRAMEVRV